MPSPLAAIAVAMAPPGAGSLSGMLMLAGLVLLGFLGATWLNKEVQRRRRDGGRRLRRIHPGRAGPGALRLSPNMPDR